MFEDYFKTSEEAGSLYRVEDLLGVVRTGDTVDDLKRFSTDGMQQLLVWRLPQMIWFSVISYSDKFESVI